MFSIKIHLDPAEHAAIGRYATALHVTPEDIAYAALDNLMNQANDPAIRASVATVRDWRGDNLPMWADSERSVHAYEGSADDQPEERVKFD